VRRSGFALVPVYCDTWSSVDERGQPYHIAISSCPTAYHEALVESLRRWRWEPAAAPLKVYRKIRIPSYGEG
jgi:hypothetical protein